MCYQGISWVNYNVSIERTELLYNFTNDKKCYRNSSLLREDIPYGNVVSPGPIFLFGFNYNGNGTLWRGSVVRIYSCKIVDNGVLVRDFVPVRVGMEGAMMDRLTRKIYRNQGTGAFKIGADKKETTLMCNSYVKDGLVAMWDGTENAGWGTHDANATTWKDLTGSRDWTLGASTSYEWTANSFDAKDQNAATQDFIDGSLVNTVEVCAKIKTPTS